MHTYCTRAASTNTGTTEHMFNSLIIISCKTGLPEVCTVHTQVYIQKIPWGYSGIYSIPWRKLDLYDMGNKYTLAGFHWRWEYTVIRPLGPRWCQSPRETLVSVSCTYWYLSSEGKVVPPVPMYPLEEQRILWRYFKVVARGLLIPVIFHSSTLYGTQISSLPVEWFQFCFAFAKLFTFSMIPHYMLQSFKNSGFS